MTPIASEFFAHAPIDSIFYQDDVTVDSRPDVSLCDTEVPVLWSVSRWEGWEGWTPPDVSIPLQGWKIHVSAALEAAAETLRRTIGVCIEHRTSFKFRYSRKGFIEINAKEAPRASAGKFITIYPVDNEALKALLDDLEGALLGLSGPYILSDVRFGNAPVFVRYGSFLPFNSMDYLDEPHRAMVEPSSMRVISDATVPLFSPPRWAAVPEILAPSIQRF